MGIARPPLKKSPSLSRLQAHIQQIGIGGPFRDTPRERHRRALALQYTLGLLLPGERKSMQPTVDRVPEAQYEAIQNFITDSPWDWHETQDRLLEKMTRELGSPKGILIVDDVPLVKKGAKSPGVSRQYCGVTGGVDNCQALVDTFYLAPSEGRNREAVGFCFALDLYLPKAWAEHPERCREAGIPTPVAFREKWRIGLEQIDRARRHALPHRAVLSDCGYGDTQEFRAELRRRDEPYVMEVTASEVRAVPVSTPILAPGERPPGETGGRRTTKAHLLPGTATASPQSLAEGVTDWVTIRWGEGTKGPLEGRFARRKVRICRGAFPTEEVGWLLMEDHPEGLRAWVCWGLEKADVKELAAIAHGRWGIERFHEEAKMELGLDHFEGRRWRGLNHHLTLMLITHTFLVREQLRAQPERVEGSEELPTLAEMRRRVVFEVAWALVSRAVLSRRKAERVRWGLAIAHYWAGAG
ncbi:MAG TPA: IS701 family transposase [Thermoplasmata archaeon]|nr:IS701 family transposase [Thermoplasmata archaeon]